ncbi:hypothetical protein F3A88_10400 [Salmonella enterica subsp. enterica serovar Typhi]|nr:hypothetical protein [Salmonella enterica subsp. enterica serovar Typhi]
MMKNITFSASFFRELFWFVVMVGSWLMKFPVFLPSHREAHCHEKDPLYRRTDCICPETG